MRSRRGLRGSLWACLVLALLVGTPDGVRADEPGTEHPSKHLSLSLLSDVQTLAPGAPFRVGVHMRMKKGWAVYWKEPGDAGLAPTFESSLPPGFEVDAASWPVPAWHKAEGAWTIVYEPEVLLVFRVWAPKTLPPVAELSVRVDWLVCHDAEGCIPRHAALALRLPGWRS